MEGFIRNKWALLIGTSAPALLYVLASSHSIGFTDSGELAASCALLGIAHPTGYPLFTNLGHAAVLIPSGLRMITILTLFCNAAAALSISVFVVLINELIGSESRATAQRVLPGERTWVLISAAFILAFHGAFFALATHLEVHALQSLLLFLNLTAAFFLFHPSRQDFSMRALAFVSFTAGLNLTNHLNSAVLIPAIVLYCATQPQARRPRLHQAFLSSSFFLLGMSAYLYLPIRSAAHPLMNWGYPDNFTACLNHITGRQFHHLVFISFSAFKQNILAFFGGLPLATGFWIFAAPFGVIGLFRMRPRYAGFLFFLLVLNCLLVSNYSIPDLEDYYLLSVIIISIFIAFAIYGFLRWQPSMIFRILLLTGSVLPLLTNIPDIMARKLPWTEIYTNQILKAASPNALILSKQWSYFTSPFLYMRWVEGHRKDVIVIDRDLLAQSWGCRKYRDWHPEIFLGMEPLIHNYQKQLFIFESQNGSNVSEVQQAFEILIRELLKAYSGPKYITSDMLDFPKCLEGFSVSIRGPLIELNGAPDPPLNPEEFLPPQKSDDAIRDTMINGLLKEYHEFFSNYTSYLRANHQAQAAEKWQSESALF